jgi:hypothetical protein
MRHAVGVVVGILSLKGQAAPPRVGRAVCPQAQRTEIAELRLDVRKTAARCRSVISER